MSSAFSHSLIPVRAWVETFVFECEQKCTFSTSFTFPRYVILDLFNSGQTSMNSVKENIYKAVVPVRSTVRLFPSFTHPSPPGLVPTELPVLSLSHHFDLSSLASSPLSYAAVIRSRAVSLIALSSESYWTWITTAKRRRCGVD